MKDVFIFIAIIIVLWVMWIASGGPELESAKKGPFLSPPTSSKNIQSEKSLYENNSGEIFVTNIIGAKKQNPNEEYVELIASRSNSNDVNISGWKLRNSVGKEIEIKKADNLAYVGMLNNEEDIMISPGNRIIISTGNSPIGVSFQVNKCSGYLEQFQNFNPLLTQNCPHPVDTAKNQSLDQSCISYISTLQECKVYTGQIPEGLSSTCTDYIRDNINHNSCIDAHKNDNDFYSGQWRIFLGSDIELWNNTSDLIRLYDTNGNLIDSAAY